MTTRSNSTDCRYCGREVLWTESKAGKKYLAEPKPIIGEEGFRVIKTIYPAHRCPTSTAEKQIIDAEIQRHHHDAVEHGEIVRGQVVEIVKGRKYPHGTIGFIDWAAGDADQFGVMKIRMVLTSGEKIYVNCANVEVVHDSRRFEHRNEFSPV